MSSEFLNYRLEGVLSKITKKAPDYANTPIFHELCNCPSRGGQLFYNDKKEEYFGKGFCNPNLFCARIQIDKYSTLTKKSLPLEKDYTKPSLVKALRYLDERDEATKQYSFEKLEGESELTRYNS